MASLLTTLYFPTPPLLASCRANMPEGKKIQLVYIEYITHGRSIRITEERTMNIWKKGWGSEKGMNKVLRRKMN
jgi:hypothetical protein